MKKIIPFIVFLFLTLHLIAQKNHLIVGKIMDEKTFVINAHIINLTNNKGAFTNDIGVFRIYASLGDSLQITSVQHKTIYKVLSEKDIASEVLDIELVSKTYVLDEIVLKKHNLTGSLLTDIKKVPKDSIKEIVQDMENTIISLAKEASKGLPKHQDPSEKGLAAIITRQTDPTKKFKGLGTIIGLGSRNKKKEKLKKITSNMFSAESLLEEIGKDFFIALKIPEKNIYSFIDYCRKFQVEKLYKEKKTLQLADLFRKKSAIYLKQVKE